MTTKKKKKETEREIERAMIERVLAIKPRKQEKYRLSRKLKVKLTSMSTGR